MNYRFILLKHSGEPLVSIGVNTHLIIPRPVPRMPLPLHEHACIIPQECDFVRSASGCLVAQMRYEATRLCVRVEESCRDEMRDGLRVVSLRCWRQSMRIDLLTLTFHGDVELITKKEKKAAG